MNMAGTRLSPPSLHLLGSTSSSSSSRLPREFFIRSSLRKLDNSKVALARVEFLEVYSKLKFQLLQDSKAFSHTKDSKRWVEEMLDYNVPGGKLNRGLSVIDNLRYLKGGEELGEDEKFLASVLGWCIEWFEAYFIMMDDILDNSITRRGKLCWYKMPQVGPIAVNDALMLLNQGSRLLKWHFQSKPYYLELLDLFNEAQFQTCAGQMLDTIVSLNGKVDVSNYVNSTYSRIVESKTAFYTFYLPVACALLMQGRNLEDFEFLKDITVLMGMDFQVQDDYLDCYGDPEVVGKIGTDIEDGKCSWMIIQALKRANEDQKKCLLDNYGKSDRASVAKVKMIYNEVALELVFKEHREKIFEKLVAEIGSVEDQALQVILSASLERQRASFERYFSKSKANLDE